MAAAIPVAGAAMSAYGALQQGQMTANSLNAQATIEQGNANEALAAGQYNAIRSQLLSGQKIGESQAAYGAAGVTSSSGSELAVLGASAANAEMDRLNIIHGSEVKAINYENQASLDQYGAAADIQGSYWKAAGDLTGGLIKSSGDWGPGPSGGEDPNISASEGTASAGGGEGAGMSDIAATA